MGGYLFRCRLTNQNPLFERRSETESHKQSREAGKEDGFMLYISIYSIRGHTPVGRLPLAERLPTASSPSVSYTLPISICMSNLSVAVVNHYTHRNLKKKDYILAYSSRDSKFIMAGTM